MRAFPKGWLRRWVTSGREGGREQEKEEGLLEANTVNEEEESEEEVKAGEEG